MLKLVLGGSGSGKTTLLYARIKARAEAGQRSILLVPEQFTSSTEGRIYRELGDALSGMVDSYSFTSLAEHILSAEGGVAVQTLSDAGRAVLVRRTLEELQDTVQYYYRHRRSAAFCQMAAETIDELKSAGLSGQQLYRLAQGCGSGSGKLTELALILQGYETLLAGTGMDPSDRLELAADRLEAALARGSLPEFLQDRAVFIDEFDTFNAPKKRLLAALLTALPQVTVALCDDGAPLVPGDTGLFAGAKLVAAQLRQLARKSGTEAAAPELLRRDLRHKDAPGLAAVTRLLEGGSAEETQAPEVRLFPAASREEEAALKEKLLLCVGSIRDAQRLDEIFARYRPEVVLHAAAHKHVPLMEDCPDQAVKNNVFGTWLTAQAAVRHGVKRFVLISTDKAVNPTNVMGATKRLAEMIIEALNAQTETEFTAVRFGNVLGSHGSVVPLFEQQIRAGGPVTLTHPDITRYFMTIPEAACLVLKAASIARGGELFVLDMGQPVKIRELAERMIQLYAPHDGRKVEIVYVGLRPGEKLYEELLLAGEGIAKTESEKIFVAKPELVDKPTLDAMLARLKRCLDEGGDMLACLHELVPTFKEADQVNSARTAAAGQAAAV